MHTITQARTRDASRPAGLAYLVASVGFLVVFSWLASHFGYPDVLDAKAETVLPQLIALGNDGRVVWIVYARLPLLLIPASIGAVAAFAGWQPGATAPDCGATTLRLTVALQIAAALCMTAGLARWSTAMWALGSAWPAADAATQRMLILNFDALNLYLGNAVGAFIGELLL